MGNYILTLDQSTTSSREILFDLKQNTLGKPVERGLNWVDHHA